MTKVREFESFQWEQWCCYVHQDFQCKVVHINNIKELLQDKMIIHRLVVVAEEHGRDTEVPRLEGAQLDQSRSEDIARLQAKWAHVLTDKPGDTTLTEHSINTGDTRPIRSQPYLISPAKLDGVKNEINGLLLHQVLVHGLVR